MPEPVRLPLPRTPLAALDLHTLVPEAEAAKLGREFDRAAVLDMVSEGVLDLAEQQQVPLKVEEQWWEAEAREQQQPGEGDTPCQQTTQSLTSTTP